MSSCILSHRVVYFSPAGTTRLVAETIAGQLRALDQTVELIDLSVLIRAGDNHDWYLSWPESCCLWIGSPVYCDHALPLVEDFIRGLPGGSAGFSVPFVTWGGVTSGLALPELAKLLREKRYPTLAAAKILAAHSSTWRAPEPLASGHPSADELQMICQMVIQVQEKLLSDVPALLDPMQLNYLPVQMQQSSAAKTLALVKAALPPLMVDETACTCCGVCAERCPMDCIELQPYPSLGPDCIRCLQCVRNCPEQAFMFNPEMLNQRILEMAASSAEPQVSRIFS